MEYPFYYFSQISHPWAKVCPRDLCFDRLSFHSLHINSPLLWDNIELHPSIFQTFNSHSQVRKWAKVCLSWLGERQGCNLGPGCAGHDHYLPHICWWQTHIALIPYRLKSSKVRLPNAVKHNIECGVRCLEWFFLPEQLRKWLRLES